MKKLLAALMLALSFASVQPASARGAAGLVPSGMKTLDQALRASPRKPLPALPLPVGSPMAQLGDSYQGYGTAATGSALVTAGNVAVNTMASTARAAWGKYPSFNIDSFYDAGDPLGRNYNGSGQGLGGDHWINDGDPSSSGLKGSGIAARVDYPKRTVLGINAADRERILAKVAVAVVP